jgi:hypothetical protein
MLASGSPHLSTIKEPKGFTSCRTPRDNNHSRGMCLPRGIHPCVGARCKGRWLPPRSSVMWTRIREVGKSAGSEAAGRGGFRATTIRPRHDQYADICGPNSARPPPFPARGTWMREGPSQGGGGAWSRFGCAKGSETGWKPKVVFIVLGLSKMIVPN